MLITNIYAIIHGNKFFKKIVENENSIILSFDYNKNCNYDIKVSTWPPIINVSEEGGGTVLFYEAPTYVDMEAMKLTKRGNLVHIILPIRKIKMSRLPSDSKLSNTIYEEVDVEIELSRLM